MKVRFETLDAFFSSDLGHRLQHQICSFFVKQKIHDIPSVLIGSELPFLTAFEKNTPHLIARINNFPEKNETFRPLYTFHSIPVIFASVLTFDDCQNCPLIIKEAARILKSKGFLFMIIKNTTLFQTISIQNCKEICHKHLLSQLKLNGFSVKNNHGLIYLPFNGKIFEQTENVLFPLNFKGGTFSLLGAQKKMFVNQSVKNFRSARMTKASVLTSPRT